MDKKIVKKLYDAAKAGVKIDIIARSTCTILPFNKNINIISIVDRYLEHARVLIFCNNNMPKYFLSSSDWLARNFDSRIEVTFPVYDLDIQQEIRRIIEIQLHDNVKARIIEESQSNVYKRTSNRKKIRAQYEIREYLKKSISK